MGAPFSTFPSMPVLESEKFLASNQVGAMCGGLTFPWQSQFSGGVVAPVQGQLPIFMNTGIFL